MCVSQPLCCICLTSHTAKLLTAHPCERTALTVWVLIVLQLVCDTLVVLLCNSPRAIVLYIFPLPLPWDSFKLQCLGNTFQIFYCLMPIEVLFSRCGIVPERWIVEEKGYVPVAFLKNHCCATWILNYCFLEAKYSVSYLLMNTVKMPASCENAKPVLCRL